MWMLPAIFPVVIAFGGALGVLSVLWSAIETRIAVFGVVLGLMLAFAVKPPIRVAALVVELFGMFHAYARGTELAESANALMYSVGFVISAGLLHLSASDGGR